MSDNPTPEPAQDPKGDNPEPKADEIDWKAEARKWEQRAKENKTAAEKLAEIEESKKSEVQKAQERIKELETRATQAERTALRTRIAAEMNVPVEVLNGDDEESIKASAQKILDWRDSGKRTPPEPKKLKSGASGGADDGRSRAAAAVRALRGTN